MSNNAPIEPNSLKKGYCVVCDATWTTADPTLPCPHGCKPPKPASNEWGSSGFSKAWLEYNYPSPPNAPDPSSLWSFPPTKEGYFPALTSIEKVLKEPLQDQIGGTHYKKLKIQPVEYVHANQLGYFEGTAIKYLSRWKDKGGLEDLRKAIHFIELLISLEEQKKELSPESPSNGKP